MSQTFDQYEENYDDVMKKSIGFMGQNHDYYTLAKAEHILNILQRWLGDTKTLNVLDVGCGVGKTDAFLFPNLGKLSGIDVSSASIDRARRDHPEVQYEVYDGCHMPFADASFEAAFLICVLHHVVPEERNELLTEARRVLKPGGVLMVFEHNPFNPLTRLAVARCEFDRDAQLLSRRLAGRLLEDAGTPVVETRYILVSPFKFKGSGWIEQQVCRIPVGSRYYAAGRKPVQEMPIG